MTDVRRTLQYIDVQANLMRAQLIQHLNELDRYDKRGCDLYRALEDMIGDLNTLEIHNDWAEGSAEEDRVKN